MQNRDLAVRTPALKRRIALGAIYAVLRQKSNNTLTGEFDFSYKKITMDSLEKFWGVPKQKWALAELFSSRKGEYPPMLELLDWFKNHGHRAGDHSNESVAWDVVRYVDVLRDAFYVGYIDRETTLSHLDIAYDISIGSFRSWEAYGSAFLAYKRHWDAGNMKELALELNDPVGEEELLEAYQKQGNTPVIYLEDAVANLLSDPQSIWNQVNW